MRQMAIQIAKEVTGVLRKHGIDMMPCGCCFNIEGTNGPPIQYKDDRTGRLKTDEELEREVWK